MDIHISYGFAFIAVLLLAVIFLVNKYVLKRKENNESEFFEELIGKYNYWKDMGEEEYAEAYKVLINKFTQTNEEQ